MTKKKILYNVIILFAFVSVCCLSISPVNTSVEVDDEQDQIAVSILSTLKSSGSIVTKRWNDTTNRVVRSVAVSANGNYMAVGTYDGLGPHILYYNTTDHDGIPMWKYDLSNEYDSFAISANGSYIVAASSGGDMALLFNSTVPEPGNNKHEVWKVDYIGASSVDISENGSLIILGGDNGLRMYNNSYPSPGLDKTNEYLWNYTTNMGVESVDISVQLDKTDPIYIAACTMGGANDNVLFFNNTDYNLGEEHDPMWSYDTTNNMFSVSISVNGSYIAAGGDDVFLFNKSAKGVKKPEWSDPAASSVIGSVAISEDNGEYIVAGGMHTGDGGWVYFFNRSDYKGQPMWKYNPPYVKSVAITANGDYVVAGTADSSVAEQHLYLFSKSAEGEKEPEWIFDTPYEIVSVSMSSSGNFIAAGGEYTSSLGRVILFYHRLSSILPPGSGDDDDDDDDEGLDIGIVVLIIVFAGFGACVVVIVVLIKKGIIDLSKLKRK